MQAKESAAMKEEASYPTSLADTWTFLMSKRDPRTLDMLFVGDIRFIIIVLGLYLFIVYYAGTLYLIFSSGIIHI